MLRYNMLIINNEVYSIQDITSINSINKMIGKFGNRSRK